MDSADLDNVSTTQFSQNCGKTPKVAASQVLDDSAIVREKDVDKLVERMGQCFLSVVEEWADNLSVHMKILFCYKPKTIDF